MLMIIDLSKLKVKSVEKYPQEEHCDNCNNTRQWTEDNEFVCPYCCATEVVTYE